MDWYWYPIMFLIAYFYVGTTTAKYVWYKNKLDYADTPDGLLPTAFFGWFILAAVEPKWLKGALYPSLWLWPRFAVEYPQMKERQRKKEEIERTARAHRNQRALEQGELQVQTNDVKDEIQHGAAMAQGQRELETLRKQAEIDHTKQLETGTAEVYDFANDEEIEIVFEFWCFTCKEGFDQDPDYDHHRHNYRRWDLVR